MASYRVLDGNASHLGADPTAHAFPVAQQVAIIPMATPVPVAQPLPTYQNQQQLDATYPALQAEQRAHQAQHQPQQQPQQQPPQYIAAPVMDRNEAPAPFESPGMVPHTPLRPSPQELRQRITQRNVEFDGARYFSEGWKFYKKNACVFLGWMMFWGTMGMILVLGAAFASKAAFEHHTPPEDREDQEGRWMTFIQSDEAMLARLVFGAIGSIFLAYPAFSSIIAAIFKAIKCNTKLNFSDCFTSFKCNYFCPLVGLAMVLQFGTTAGFMLFIVPGVWFSIASSFAIPLHHQHKPAIGIFESISLSCKVINRHFCSFFGFLMLMGMLNMVGFMFLGFGVLATFPISLLSFCYCYHHLVGINEVTVMVPATEMQFAAV